LRRAIGYSPLSQIDAGSFSKLEVAWTFSTANPGPVPETNLESTPLVIDGILYSTAGDRRDVIALNAATGELLWAHREDEGKRAEVAPRFERMTRRPERMPARSICRHKPFRLPGAAARK
jgi:glucose dehydrogenase